MKNRYLLLALVLVVLVNGVVLLGVAGNRKGKAEATLVLTERELSYNQNFRKKENSGVSLQLDANLYAHTGTWFDERILADLGFDVETIKRQRQEGNFFKHYPPKRGYLVLEYAGGAWRSHKAEQEAEIAELRGKLSGDTEADKGLNGQIARIRYQLQSNSRLFPVDAGPDPELLRQRHPERDRFVIVAAELNIVNGYKAGESLKCWIDGLLITQLHVPRDLQGPLADLPPRKYGFPLDGEEGDRWQPRYEVVVKWGSRFEPWVEAVRLVPAGGDAREMGD